MGKTLWTNRDLTILHLITEEFEITKEKLFSTSQHRKTIHAISVLSDILVRQYGIPPKKVHNMFLEKGYAKTRTNVYNYLKIAERLLKKDSQALSSYKYIVEDVEGARIKGEELKRKNEHFRLVGRVFAKINKLESDEELREIESKLNIIINARKEKETWLT